MSRSFAVRAITFQAVGRVAVEEVAEPVIMAPTDAVVRVEVAALCGSDLHPFHGREVGLDRGTVMGHEFVGHVVALGSAVESLQVGDRVVSPFTTSCGRCFYCQQGLTARCTQGQLFGWVENGAGLHGAQAELVRVPLAASTLVKLPDGTAADEALLAGDVLSTGYYAATLGGVDQASVVAVVGAGPVGLCAAVSARVLGARAVFIFDSVRERLALAETYGAIGCDIGEAAPRAALLDATDGRGADVVLECVGSPAATRSAFELARPGATIAAAGVHTEPSFSFSPGEAYDKNLTYRAGRCPARSMMERTLPLVTSGAVELSSLFSHRLPLSEGAHAYEIFAGRLHGCTKVLFTIPRE